MKKTMLLLSGMLLAASLSAVPARADGPSLPPMPWDGYCVTHDGPSLPPMPWDGHVYNAGVVLTAGVLSKLSR